MNSKKISVKTAACPGCGASGSLRRIVWGLPLEAIDFEKYALGGVIIPESPHELACSLCPWSGHRGQIIPMSRTFRTGN